ncbi:MAG TPA: DUF1385 domain-containing protein [Clostridia bacterium]|nr:DUF1385 domain-containing protein [Clostridia bacterium]
MKYKINGLSCKKGIEFSSEGIIVKKYNDEKIKIEETKNKLWRWIIAILFVYVIFIEFVNLNIYRILLLLIPLLCIFLLNSLFNTKSNEFHSAEHMAINAYEEEGYVDRDNIKKYSRTSKKCGTTYILLLFSTLIIFAIINLFIVNKLIYLILLTFFLYIQYDYLKGYKKLEFIYKFVYPVSLFVQKKFLTNTPEEKNLKVAVEGINVLIGELNKKL